MVMTMWDGKPATFKSVWLTNLKLFATQMNGYTEWLNLTMGVDNTLSAQGDFTLPDGFGRDRRNVIVDQLKVVKAYLGDVDDVLNNAALDYYDDQGNRIAFHLSWTIEKPPLTNDAKYYNTIFKKLDDALSLMENLKQSQADEG